MVNESPKIPEKKKNKRPFVFRVFLQQLINFIIWLIVTLLVIRMLLLLLNANPEAPFASYMFSISDYLVWPFQGLFSSKGSPGSGYFDTNSFVGIIVYLLVGLGLNKLLSVTRT